MTRPAPEAADADAATRVVPGGEWADEVRSWVREFDGPSVGVTTLRIRDDPAREGSNERTDLPYGHAAHDLIYEDTSLGAVGHGQVRTLLASAVVDDDPGPTRVPESQPGATVEADVDVSAVVPGEEPDGPAETFERYDALLDGLDADDLTPATLERLDGNRVVSAHLAAAEGERREEWLGVDTRRRFGGRYDELVDGLIDEVDEVVVGGGTFTKCQARFVRNLLGATEDHDLSVRVDDEHTFTVDTRREPAEADGGIAPEGLADRDRAEATLAAEPPSLAEAGTELSFWLRDEIEARRDRYEDDERVTVGAEGGERTAATAAREAAGRE